MPPSVYSFSPLYSEPRRALLLSSRLPLTHWPTRSRARSSAIRISSHTADFYPPHTNLAPRPLVKKSRVGRAGAPDAPSAPDSRRPAASQGVKKVKVGEQELDEAIRSALEDTWHLSAAGRADPMGETGGKSDGIDEASIERAPSGRPEDVAERNTQSRRSLAELYEELHQMGISVDELNEVMQNAIGGNL